MLYFDVHLLVLVYVFRFIYVCFVSLVVFIVLQHQCLSLILRHCILPMARKKQQLIAVDEYIVEDEPFLKVSNESFLLIGLHSYR